MPNIYDNITDDTRLGLGDDALPSAVMSYVIRRESVVAAFAVVGIGLGVASAPAATAAGAAGNRRSYAPEVSTNGRYVVFASDATNLAPGDTNGKRDIYLRDTVARTTTRVTKAISGQPNGHSFDPSVSDDGRYVAFLSDATNLVTGDTNRVTDAFRADLRSGTITRVSGGPNKTQSNGVTTVVAMSATGTSVVFETAATNLAPGDTNSRPDVYLRDVAAAAPRRLSANASGGITPSISPDGKWVGFLADYNGMAWNRATNATTRVCKEEPYDGYSESHCDEVVASNAGVSSVWSGFTGCCTYSYGIEVLAKPASLSFGTYFSPFYDWVPDAGLDVTTFGATALVRYAEEEGGATVNEELRLLDASGTLARLGVDSRSAALSGNGAVVVMEQGQQIVLWNRGNGSTTVVSVN